MPISNFDILCGQAYSWSIVFYKKKKKKKKKKKMNIPSFFAFLFFSFIVVGIAQTTALEF